MHLAHLHFGCFSSTRGRMWQALRSMLAATMPLLNLKGSTSTRKSKSSYLLKQETKMHLRPTLRHSGQLLLRPQIRTKPSLSPSQESLLCLLESQLTRTKVWWLALSHRSSLKSRSKAACPRRASSSPKRLPAACLLLLLQEHLQPTPPCRKPRVLRRRATRTC
jgi:hypothetical protein